RRSSEFDFGLDEYDEEKSAPEYFPWRDFLSVHRESLIALVNENITPALIDMFYGTSFFSEYYNAFKNYFTTTEGEIKR
ncbi:hypothetical protein, partial [Pseudomonas aeruginosa]|uniref:hypothetical protein n=1 Tax=Pseudomonas aeruginosa TaxID=287 RepID=UPI002E814190